MKQPNVDYSISKARSGDQIPHHLLLLADENQQFIDAYLPLSQVYLLKVDAQIQGICLLQVNGETGEIMNIAVDPACQGRGLGKALLHHVFGVARAQGLGQLVIKTGNSGIGQIALYQQMGFNLVSVNYDYFLQAYAHPIWENNIQCKHQLVFELVL